MRWSEAGYLSRIALTHALRQVCVSLILGVRQNQTHAEKPAGFWIGIWGFIIGIIAVFSSAYWLPSIFQKIVMPAGLFGITAWMAVIGFQAARSGIVRFKGLEYARAYAPLDYWFFVAFYLFVAFAMFVILAVSFLPPSSWS